MFAAMFDRDAMIVLLLGRGADPARTDAGGVTALAIARTMGELRAAAPPRPYLSRAMIFCAMPSMARSSPLLARAALDDDGVRRIHALDRALVAAAPAP